MNVPLKAFSYGTCLSVLVTLLAPSLAESGQAQIIPASNDTGTIATPMNNEIMITGGRTSRNQLNLFHSFLEFSIQKNQTANFYSNPGIQNILVRVVGGNASQMDGTLRVTGMSNLYFMNPAGILFGSSAVVNVPGSFTATTANGIGLGDRWFNANGTNTYDDLNGTPERFAFTMAQPGAIVNLGQIMVGVGQQLALIGGTVISSGSLSAPEGHIVVAAVPGERVVRLTPEGGLLSFEIPQPTATNQPEAWNLPILSLPQLLTGGIGTNASEVVVNSAGQVQLWGSGLTIASGDVVIRNPNTGASGKTTISYLNDFIPLPPASGVFLPPTTNFPADCLSFCPPVKPFSQPPASSKPLPPAPLPQDYIPTPTYTFDQNQSQTTTLPLAEPLPQGRTGSKLGAPMQPAEAKPRSPITLPLGQQNHRILTPLSESSPTTEEESAEQGDSLPNTLEELRVFFRQRWKPLSNQSTSLRYRVVLNYRGTVQQMEPLNLVAANYLEAGELSVLGTAIVTPTQRSWTGEIVLNTDGSVQILPDSLTLKN